jgi:hypothetical protein
VYSFATVDAVEHLGRDLASGLLDALPGLRQAGSAGRGSFDRSL